MIQGLEFSNLIGKKNSDDGQFYLFLFLSDFLSLFFFCFEKRAASFQRKNVQTPGEQHQNLTKTNNLTLWMQNIKIKCGPRILHNNFANEHVIISTNMDHINQVLTLTVNADLK